MAKYKVFLTTTLSATVTVEVDDAYDLDEAREDAIETALEEVPRDLPANVVIPWGKPYTLDMGDEWDVSKDGAGVEHAPELIAKPEIGDLREGAPELGN